MPVAETLGIVGSIIAIVQISKTIIVACQFYIDTINDAPSDLRVILIEVSTLKGIAKSLQYLTKPNVANSALLDQLASVTGPIEGCKKALKDLERLFPPTSVATKGQGSKRRKLDAAIAALAWPLKAGKAKRLLQEIVQHKTTINLALTAEFVQDLKDVKQKTEWIQDFLSESERNGIYTWLETTNPSNIHNRSQRLYEPGTGAWMLRSSEWPLWIEGKTRCLWVHGIPGAGKSILASHLATEVAKHCDSLSSEHAKFGHAYYYCYFGHNQDEATHFVRWVVGQLCRQSGKVPKELHEVHKSGKNPDMSSLLSILGTTLQAFERVYIVLDAVDESKPRTELLTVIRNLSTDARLSSLALVATSRRYKEIVDVMKTCSTPISMSNPLVQEDIGVLVRSTVQADLRYKEWPEELRREMQETIPKRAKGMFRWAVCQLDALRRLRPDATIIRTALGNLPKTLDETYDRIFLAIPEDDRLSVQHILHWILYNNELFEDNISVRTLLAAVQNSSLGLRSPEAHEIYDMEGLQECCSCLISVDRERLDLGGGRRYERNVVSFAHYTVKEYLESSRVASKKVGYFAFAQEHIQKEFALIAFRQALALQTNGHHEYDSSAGTVFRLLDEDFGCYCGVFSALQLHKWPSVISVEPALMELSERFVRLSGPTGEEIRRLLNLPDMFALWVENGMDRDSSFWKIDWKKDPDPNAETFLCFLLGADWAGRHLAPAFANRHSMLPVLTAQLRFTMEFDVYDTHDRTCEFIGSIPELVAQQSPLHPDIFDLILDLISDQGTAHFDLSKILLLCVGNHRHRNCKTSCPLERLLDFGASANGPEGACMTPLQIATSCWDICGVKTLLTAGADVDATRNDGLRFPPDSVMGERFNRFFGLTPLDIIRYSDWKYMEEIKREVLRKEIEGLLLQFGAKGNESHDEEVIFRRRMVGVRQKIRI